MIGMHRMARGLVAPAMMAGVVAALLGMPAFAASRAITLPPAGGAPDYQLGGAYPPDPRVQIVARDRGDPPAPGRYSICYINGFQTQPHELSLWPEELILHRNGQPVGDPDWPGEYLLDTTTAAKRAGIFAIVQPWIEGCASAGFDAVEFDNLDTYTRSQGQISRANNVAMAKLYADEAHRLALAAAQKNAAEDSATFRAQAGFDFAVSEECVAWDECDDYVVAYGTHVIDIEYPDDLPVPFQQACDAHPEVPSMVLRDVNLTTPGQSSYVFELCDRAGLPDGGFGDGFELVEPLAK